MGTGLWMYVARRVLIALGLVYIVTTIIFLVLHLIYDVRDVMGANAVNTAVEFLTPRIESLTGGRVHLRILSNLADRRLARANVTFRTSDLTFEGFAGERVRDEGRIQL